jgi:aspartyl-tRNA synthetase
MTFQDAMDRYGSDKPDTRFGMEIKDLGEIVKGSGFKVFDDTLARGGFIRGIPVPTGGSFSRAQLDKLTEMAKKAGAKGLVWIKWDAEGITSSVSKFFSPEKLKEMLVATGAKQGDATLIIGDDFEVMCASLNVLRLHLGKELKQIDTTKYKFLWVTDFPLLEYSPDDKRWVARHHPFTSPADDAFDDLLKQNEKNYGKMLAKAYDLVCNGYEMGGGSVRIYRNEIQQAMFKVLGMSEAETQSKFGFFLEAFKYGAPPHGGIGYRLGT